MISKLAVVETSVIGSGTRIEEFAVVRAGAELGNDVIIHPHVVIEDGVVIGDGVEIFPGTYVGKEPKGAGATARSLEFDRTVNIGANCSIGPNAVVYYHVSIGENTLIGDSASVREQCVIGERCVVGTHVTVGYAVRIQDRVKIVDQAQIVGKSLIERDAFIGPRVGMANDPLAGTGDFDEERIQGVTVRERAMISVGATLVPGVEVGERAVVAAGSLVGKDVPADKMAMGVPAKLFRKINRSRSGREQSE